MKFPVEIKRARAEAPRGFDAALRRHRAIERHRGKPRTLQREEKREPLGTVGETEGDVIARPVRREAVARRSSRRS